MNPVTVDTQNFTISPVLQWITAHWLIVLICVIILLLLIFTVIIPGIYSLLQRSKKVSETKDLKKDLMIWKNLSFLVQGGDKAQNAKKELSLQLQSIRLRLKQGISLLSQTRRKKYDVPWFMILGEPQAGKSELLKNSSLDLHSTANLDSSVTAALPLNCWIGPKTFVLDVAGRVFFDRWLEGSGAEWNYLINLLKKQHKRRPLDGVILTIPADALIADDTELTKQKAALIGSELYQLLRRTGMNLPCHVIVTKMDMLLGFREFFAHFTEEDRHAIFGWANKTVDGIFDGSDFNCYYDALIDKIRNGSTALMLNKELFQQKSSAERMEISGKCYLFADNMNRLRKNLSVYLTLIFGKEGWNGHDQSILSGVFFTSAQDNGIVLSPSFAETAGKPLEEAVIVSKEQYRTQSAFIRDLLKNMIFSCKIPASFTAKERFKRQVPGYLVCLVFAALGGLWLSTAVLQKDIVHERLQTHAQYYNNLAENFANKNIDKSPLVSFDEKGVPQLLNDQEMNGYPHYSRLQFFYDAYNRANEDIIIPWGFKLSGLLHLGLHQNPMYFRRQYIFNMLQSQMSFLPTVKTLQHILLFSDGNEAFTRNKREAVFDFSEIAFSRDPKYKYFIPLDAMLLYLFPETNVDTINLLASYQKKIFWNNQDVLAQIIYHYDYSKAQKKAFEHFFSSWRNLSIYPETMYPQTQSLIRNSSLYAKNQNCILMLSSKTAASTAEQGKTVELLQKILQEQLFLQNNIQIAMEKLAVYPELSSIIFLNTSSSGKSHIHPGESLLNTALMDYRKRLETDKKEIYSYITQNRQLLTGRGSEVFFKIEHSIADSTFAVIEEKLNSELKLLNSEITFLQQQKLFAAIKSNPQKEMVLVDSEDKVIFHIYTRLNKVVSALSSVQKLKAFEDFSVQWRKNNQELQRVVTQLKEIRKQYEHVPEVVKIIDGYIRIAFVWGNYNRNILVSELMHFYPKTETALFTLIEKLKKTDRSSNPLHTISPELAVESVGKLNIPSQYEPSVALQLFVPWEEIQQCMVEEAKKSAVNPFSVNVDQAIKTTLHSYIDDYLKFWGAYPDSLTPPMNQWSEFKAFCRKMKPYEVNSLLLTVYKSCAENLSAIPVSLLSENQKKYRNTLLEDINAKTQVLTPHFSGVCIRQVNSWSLLPQKPEAAFQFLHSRSDKELLSDYLALVATGNKGDIPWWSKFFQTGISLLRDAASQQIFDSLNQTDRNIFRFPLCKDAVLKDEFSESELYAAWGTLQILVKKITPEKSRTNATGSNEVLSLFSHLDVSAMLDKKDYQWLDNILLITDALTNRNKPLQWTVTIPDMNQQKKLNEAFTGNVPLAMHRYRYIAVSSGNNRQILNRQILNRGIVVKGGVIEKNLTFDFFAYSDENSPAGSLKVDGNWPIIRLYLSKGSYYEVEKKMLFVPLHIRDRYDAVSILWVGITFNQVLPLPENWPSSENWPDFSKMQKHSKYQAITSWDLIKLIKENDSYEKLLKKLDKKTFTKPPVFEIMVDGRKSKAFLARYRYVEVILPGQKIRKKAIASDTVLALCDLSTPEIGLKFYQFSDDKKSVAQNTISGAYAPLKLLMSPGREITGKTSFNVPVKMKGEVIVLKINIK